MLSGFSGRLCSPPPRSNVASGEVQRTMKCCGGPVVNDQGQHAPDCPSIVRAALSWIAESPMGERHRKRGLAAFEAILAERDELRRQLGEQRG